MKTFLIPIFILISFCKCISQDELEFKYWNYRKAFNESWVINNKDNAEGSFLPFDKKQFDTDDNNTNRGSKYITMGDEPKQLGYYIGVLATEYALLKYNNKPTEATLKELYFAIKAFERLDVNAEWKLRNNHTPPLSRSLDEGANGFFMQDDATHKSFQDYLISKNLSNANFLDSVSGIDATNQSSYYNFYKSFLTEKKHQERKEPSYISTGTMSPDMVAYMMMGFALVSAYVPSSLTYQDDAAFNFVTEAKKHVDNMVTYI